jgi:hypothetical protein
VYLLKPQRGSRRREPYILQGTLRPNFLPSSLTFMFEALIAEREREASACIRRHQAFALASVY